MSMHNIQSALPTVPRAVFTDLEEMEGICFIYAKLYNIIQFAGS